MIDSILLLYKEVRNMNVLYINSNSKFGYDNVIISDNTQKIYEGRLGTIPIKTEDEYVDIVILNGVYEKLKHQNSLIKSILIVLSVIFATGDYFTYGLGGPNVFKIKLEKQTFMELRYDHIYTNSFKSNVMAQVEKVRDKEYFKYWLFSYVIPFLISFFFLVFITLGLYRFSALLSIIVGLISLYLGYIFITNVYKELKK